MFMKKKISGLAVLSILACGLFVGGCDRSTSSHLSNTYSFFGTVEEFAARWQARSADSLGDFTSDTEGLKDELVRLGLKEDSSWGNPWTIASVDQIDSSFYNGITIEYPMGVDDVTDGEDLAARLERNKTAVTSASYDGTSETLTVQLEID